ncbi:MAG: hypothetical protein LBF34_01890, partial [Puniceicoccales bacterium]|nr:hypothetical protein [Puniceicoccales bacterium]
MDRVGGSGGLPQIPIDTSRAQEAPAPKLASLLQQDSAVKHQASEQSDITPGALAARTAAVKTAKRGNSLKGGIKADTDRGVLQGFAARQKNAKTIAARVLAYGSDVESSIKREGAPF